MTQQNSIHSKADVKADSITTLSSREIYRNPWLALREDQILRSNGQPGIYGVVDKDDCAIIIPVQGDHVWLVEQFRYTIQERCVELPQGGWETADVDAEEMARGELKEELGFHADRMIYLGFAWIAYGFARQKQHVFLALGLSGTDKDPDPEEHDLISHSVPIIEFEQMMLDGAIRDCSTLAAWGLYLLWKSRQ
jgi:8-oxo-dGTP pyrophosphatase MutT (NUDIX family)